MHVYKAESRHTYGYAVIDSVYLCFSSGYALLLKAVPVGVAIPHNSLPDYSRALQISSKIWYRQGVPNLLRFELARADSAMGSPLCSTLSLYELTPVPITGAPMAWWFRSSRQQHPTLGATYLRDRPGLYNPDLSLFGDLKFLHSLRLLRFETPISFGSSFWQ